jgi:hypothetical protein
MLVQHADDLLLRESALPHDILLGDAFPVRTLIIRGSVFGGQVMKTIGLKGGQAMLKKYGREFYSEIGRIGKRREEGEDV